MWCLGGGVERQGKGIDLRMKYRVCVCVCVCVGMCLRPPTSPGPHLTPPDTHLTPTRPPPDTHHHCPPLSITPASDDWLGGLVADVRAALRLWRQALGRRKADIPGHEVRGRRSV